LTPKGAPAIAARRSVCSGETSSPKHYRWFNVLQCILNGLPLCFYKSQTAQHNKFKNGICTRQVKRLDFKTPRGQKLVIRSKNKK
jgi:hypothetical protein